jgi:ParB family chromosome partitioning protein
MIVNIPVEKIEGHPQNPRKDLGDLTELAESIKQNGILQNLTVVPWFSEITGVGADDPVQQERLGYIVVIGHRRLAAAKLAGLKDVPCIISDMDKKKQLGTMLTENMQRSDLTVYEQAQGFQMMLDIGEKIEDITEKTGFSKSTVRRRVKLLELDQKKFKESVKRGATLMDYAEIEKIKDIEKRNEVLEKVGTSNFQWELKRALDAEQREKQLESIAKELDQFAQRVEEIGSNFKKVGGYFYDYKGGIEKPKNKNKYFYIHRGYSVDIYEEDPDYFKKLEEEQTENEKEREKTKERCKELRELHNQARYLRKQFIFKVSNTDAKNNMGIIVEKMISNMWRKYYVSLDDEDIIEIFELHNKQDEIEFEMFKEKLRQQPEKTILLTTYKQLDGEREEYWYYEGKYKENTSLDQAYELLEALGYQISDEEIAMKNGTHAAYKKE